MSQTAVRAHIVMPAKLVHEIDALVGPRKRSQFVTELVERELRRRRLLRVAGALEEAGETPSNPAWATSEGAAAWVSALRREERDPWQSEELTDEAR